MHSDNRQQKAFADTWSALRQPGTGWVTRLLFQKIEDYQSTGSIPEPWPSKAGFRPQPQQTVALPCRRPAAAKPLLRLNPRVGPEKLILKIRNAF